jgi:hypothetical protein
MTPPAMTAAGGRTRKAASHRRVLRPSPAPAAPRRVSGPIILRPTPRRESPRHVPVPLHERGLELIRGLPDHALLDRIVRGRAWIPILGVMLAGIVAMQVEVLKLGASIGRSLALTSTLQSRNDLLRANVSALADAQRIERLASGMGMVMPGPTSLDFVAASHADAGQAAGAIHAPNASAFTSALQASILQANAATAAPNAAPASTASAAPLGATATTPTTTSTTPTTTTTTPATTSATTAPTTSTTPASTSTTPASTATTPAPGATGGAAP